MQRKEQWRKRSISIYTYKYISKPYYKDMEVEIRLNSGKVFIVIVNFTHTALGFIKRYKDRGAN